MRFWKDYLVSRGILTMLCLFTLLVPTFAGPDAAAPASAASVSTPPAAAQQKAPANAKAVRPNRLKELEKSLFDPGERTHFQNSMEEKLNPPMQSPRQIISPQQRLEIERRKNWIFADPDDPAAAPSMEKMFGLPEYDTTGKDKTKHGAVERYLQKSDKTSASKLNRANTREARDLVNDFNRGKSIVDDERLKRDLGLPETIGTAEDDLRKRIDESRSAPGTGRSTLTDIFGLGKKIPTEDETRKRKERMNEFRELIGLSPVATTLSESRSQNGLAAMDNGISPGTAVSRGLAPAQRPDWLSNPFGKPVQPTGAYPRASDLGNPSSSQPAYTPPPLAAPPKSTLPQYPISHPQDFSFQRRAF
jgi:hypothetical protein